MSNVDTLVQLNLSPLPAQISVVFGACTFVVRSFVMEDPPLHTVSPVECGIVNLFERTFAPPIALFKFTTRLLVPLLSPKYLRIYVTRDFKIELICK